MKVVNEKQPKNLIKLTIELNPDEIKPYLLSAASRLSERTEIPGFRPGKAPYDLVKQRFGEAAIYEEVAEEVVKKTYIEAVLEQKLEVIGRPQIQIQKMAPGNLLVYTATVALMPEVKLGDYQKLKTRKKKAEVKPEELKKTMAELRKMRAKETLANRPAQTGDKVEIDFELSIDGVPVDGGSNKKFPVVLGENRLVPGFEKNLIGLKAGAKKDFQLEYPKEYFQKNLAGRKVDCSAKVNTVYQIELPAWDDAFAKLLGSFKNIQEVEEKIEVNLKAEADHEEEHRFERELLKEIIDRTEFGEIPEILLEAEGQRMMAEFKSGIEERGIKYDDYLEHLKKSEAEIAKDFQPQAVNRIKSALVLRAIRLKENITVDTSQLEAEIKKQKEVYKNDLDTYNKIDSPEYRDQYEEMLLNRKVFDYLDSLINPPK
ncbi:MAG: trigger factor [Patescibacteria group bacterium]|nr:trigger factor [Patescibacteria group bacterium]